MWRQQLKTGEPADVAALFGCSVGSLPGNVCLIGWTSAIGWIVSPAAVVDNPVFAYRVPALLDFLGANVVPRLVGNRLWFLLCFSDGWRERNRFSTDYRWVEPGDLTGTDEWHGRPGEIPTLASDRRRIACFAAHHGDPSAVLWPDAHYLGRQFYRALFGDVFANDTPWARRQPRAVLAAGDHGDPDNILGRGDTDDRHARRLLQDIVAANGLAVDVYLGQGIPVAEQLGYRYLLDVDGFTRTWEAWAWKMMSGSVVLSPASPWESFFSRQFEPWEHFVPVANDFSDLGEQLDWCRANDSECREIAERARRRATFVYAPETVARIVVETWPTDG